MKDTVMSNIRDPNWNTERNRFTYKFLSYVRFLNFSWTHKDKEKNDETEVVLL